MDDAHELDYAIVCILSYLWALQNDFRNVPRILSISSFHYSPKIYP